MAPAIKGYDDTLKDVAKISIIESFFAESRLAKRIPCPNCNAPTRIVLVAGDARMRVCVAQGCGWEAGHECQ